MTLTPENPSSSKRSNPVLALLGGLATLWAVFLWWQLLETRSGATPICLSGGDCTALWDGPFASAVHTFTLLPVAGWGVLWGLLATVFPALAITRQKRSEPLEGAVALVALAGILGVVALLLVSAAEGLFCANCSLTYALTAIYALIALPRSFSTLRHQPRGAVALVGTGLVMGWLLLQVPARATPKNLARVGLEALTTDEAPRSSESGSTQALPSVEEFLASLDPALHQGIADSLAILERSPTADLAAATHYSLGGEGAAVQFTEWTDILCGHCAQLHQTFEYLQETLPTERFSLVSRHFPLDGHCNPHLVARGEESVRCLAARAQICVEPTGHGFEYSGALFQMQGQLENAALVYRLAEPFIDRAALGACISSPNTLARLEADVDEAWKFRPRGTPLVLVNGRQGTHFGPFLYALALADGRIDHPGFALLPPFNPAVVEATLEGASDQDDHTGHEH